MPALRHSRQSLTTGASLALTGALILSFTAAATAATTDPDPSAREIAHAALSRQAATEGMVLLENTGGLPMRRSGNVALFGPGAYDTVKGGTGSGDVNNRDTVTVREGVEAAGYTVTTSAAYWDAMVAAYTAAGEGQFAAGEVPLTTSSAQPTHPTETAVYVLARNSGEGADRNAVAGDYYLTGTELSNLAQLGRTYRKVVVVLNVGAVMDTTFFREVNHGKHGRHGRHGKALDALLLMSQPGQEAGHALVDVLNGTVSPSGKLVDTWASRYDYYPAAETFAHNDGDAVEEEYREGIYVGYRYFDSFYGSIGGRSPSKVVNYPFGFGRSYTDFDISTRWVKADAKAVTVRAKVTNTGKRASGKEVVQVYFSAPTKGVDKPYQELAAYAKTDTLAPGKSQTLTLSFRTTEMSSYDESKAAYVLDAGKYPIRVGNSSRNTSVAAVLRLDRTVRTERLANNLEEEAVAGDWTSDPSDFYTYRGEASQIARAPVVKLRASAFRTRDNTSPLEQDVRVNASNDYYPIDGNLISSVTAYLERGQTNWDGTGAPYQPKTGESVRFVDPVPAGTTLFDVADGSVSMKRFVAGLSVEQLQDIVEGGTGGVTPSTSAARGGAGATTARHEDVGIPSASLVDGPAGVRITQSWTDNGQTYYQFATAWPIGTMLAQTWNEDVIETVGGAIGTELKEFGATLWLAPGMNIHRDPLNGRNFEYFSEDPLLSGRTASAETRSVQATAGIGVTLKHFAANNQESQRMNSNSRVSERALREIYLKGFEIAVKEAQPMAIMSSYNRINGPYTAGFYDLLTDLARGEWKFAGLVMSDWSGVRAGVIDGAYAGNDIWMPGPGFLGGYVGEISDALHGVVTPPNIQTTIDVAGLPKYIWASNAFTGGAVYNWVTGPWRLNAGGEVFATTTVDSSVVGAARVSGQGGFAITSNVNTPDPPFTSVQQAYEFVQRVIARPHEYTMNTRAAAGIEVDITEGTPAAVTEFTVTLRGNRTKMRLGDLQRSATRILTVLTHTSQFEELASIQGVPGISVQPYTSLFGDRLVRYVRIVRGPVTPA